MVVQAMHRKQPIPDWAQNEPLIENGDEFYLTSFSDLSTCRQVGMAVGPIPWKDIVFYASYHGLDSEMTDIFLAIIKDMDAAYLEWQRAEQAKLTNQQTT